MNDLQPSSTSHSDVSAPAHETDPCATTETVAPVERKVYSLGQVVCGTFFGSLFCTAFIVRNNYKAFGKDASATTAFWLLLSAAIVLIFVSLLIPGRFGGTAISLVCLFIMSNWYTSHMLREYKSYTRSVGRQISNWWVVGLILLCQICQFGLGMAIVLGCEAAGIIFPD